MADNTIDTLQIKIVSDADKAVQALNKLSNTFNGLNKAMGNMNKANFGGITGAVKQLSEATSKLDIAKVSNYAKAIDTLKKSMSGIGSAAGQLNKATTGLERISSLDFSKISKIPDMSNLASLGVSISGFADGAKNLAAVKPTEINRVIKDFEKLGKINLGNLNNIATNFSAFSTALNSVGNISKLSEIGTAFQGFATALSGADKISAGTTKIFTALSQLATSANNIPIVTQTLPGLSSEIGRFIAAMAQAPQVQAGTVSIVTALSGLAAAGGKATMAAAALPALTQGMSSFIETMSRMPTLNTNVVSVIQALAQFSTAGGRAGGAAQRLQGNISGLSKSMMGLHGGIGKANLSLNSFLRNAAALAGVSYGFYAIGNALRKSVSIASQLTEVQNVIDVTFGDAKGQLESFAATSIQSLGMSELTAKQMAGRFQGMGVALGNMTKESQQSMANMSIELTGLAGDMASFYDVNQKVVGQDLEAIYTGQTKPLRKYGIDLTQATLKSWALSKGIDANFKSMTQLEKVQLRYAYVMEKSGYAQGDFARTSGTWANQTRILGQQFQKLGGTLGQGLINMFLPVVKWINILLGKLQVLANAFKSLTAFLFGDASKNPGGIITDNSGLDDAAGSAGDLAGGLGDANSEAKKLQGNLRDFDELNVISSASGSGGSGGGGVGSDLDFGNINSALNGEMEKLEEKVSEFAQRIADAFKTGDFKSLGSYISGNLTAALKSIRWEPIYEIAGNFGNGLADFLNGLITPELFGEVGRNIAGALNTALYGVLSFGLTFDWTNLGVSIASGINNFFSTFDFAALGQGVSIFAVGLLNSLNAGLTNIEWYNIGKQIGTFLANLNWTEILSEAGKAIVLGLGASIELYMGSLSVAPLETAIITGIAAFKFKGVGKAIAIGIGTALTGGIDLGKIAITIQGFSTNFNSASFVIIGTEILNKIESYIKEHFGQGVADAMGEGLLIVTGAGVGVALGGPIGALIGGAIGIALDTFVVKGEQITRFWKKIGSDLFNWDTTSYLWNYTKEAFSKAFSAENFAEFGINIVDGIVNGMAAAVTLVLEPIADMFDEIVKGICDLFGIHSPAKEMEPYGGYILQGIIEGFRNTFQEWTKALNEWFEKYITPWFSAQKWSDLYNTIKTSLKTKWDETVGQWSNDIQSWWDYDVSPWFTTEKWLGIAGGIKDGIKNAWDNTVVQWRTDIQSWWDNDVIKWFTKEQWTKATNGIKEGLSSSFNSAVDAVKGIWNGFAKWLNDKLSFNMPEIKNPLTGETIFGGDTIQLGKLPILENGGVLRKGQFGFLEGNGAEAVVPLENNTKWVSRVADLFNYQMANNAPKYEINYRMPDMPVPQTNVSRFGMGGSGNGEAIELLTEIRQQNELLREQSELLKGIYDKPVVDKNDVGNLYKAYAKDFRSETGKQLGLQF